MLATGGAAALWQRTTNPWGAIGAGPVLAQAAGADLADLEFCQFHPTALSQPGSPADGLLITEAVRGEGATLLDSSGRRFTDELAPRDAVTAAILDRMGADGTDHVLIDLRGVEPGRFPNVFAGLHEAGLSPESEPVPVAPAAHYLMGGIAVDLDGAASVPGLYAVGEASCTGLHGANRLASNSLSECFVFGRRAATAACAAATGGPTPEPPRWRFEPPTASTREAVWRLAGPRRRPEELRDLLADPYPLAAADRRGGPVSRGVPRRPSAHRLHRPRPGARRRPFRPRRGRRDAARALGLSRPGIRYASVLLNLNSTISLDCFTCLLHTCAVPHRDAEGLAGGTKVQCSRTEGVFDSCIDSVDRSTGSCALG